MLRLVTLAFLCSTLCIDSHAGGMIRRVPEVGEYARYAMIRISDTGGEAGARESVGQLTIKCVGSEVVDGNPCRWMEIEAVGFSSNQPSRLIAKVLMSVDVESLQSSEGGLIRGWARYRDGTAPVSFDIADPVPNESPARDVIRMVNGFIEVVFYGAPDEAPVEAATAIEIAGETREFTSAFSGTRSTESEVEVREGERTIRTAPSRRDTVSTWWPDEEVAFGVAVKASQSRTVTMDGDRILQDGVGSLFRYELAEFGTGATSDLQYYN